MTQGNVRQNNRARAFAAHAGVPAASLADHQGCFSPEHPTHKLAKQVRVASLINSLLTRRRGLIRHAPDCALHLVVRNSRSAQGVTDHASAFTHAPQISETRGKLIHVDFTV
jgi:hypothetical protein